MKYSWTKTGNGIEDDLGKQLQKIARNMNENKISTRYRYLEASGRFISYVSKEFRLMKLANVQDKHLVRYADNLKGQGKSHKYIKNELSAIRYIHNQIETTRYDLMDGKRLNKEIGLNATPDGRSDRAWTVNEFNQFSQKAIDTNNEEFSNIFEIVRHTGMRLDEVCTLKKYQVVESLKNGSLKLTNTKGGKPRDIPLNSESKSLLVNQIETKKQGDYVYVPKEYVVKKEIHKYEKKIQNFLYNHRGSIQDNNRALSGHNVGQNERAALTFHGLRHMYARNRYEDLKKQGSNEYVAKKTVSIELGHGREEITSIYLGKK